MEKQLGSDTARSAASLQESWARIRGRLREEVGEVEYRTWLRQMTLVGIEDDEVVVNLPTRFLRDWVRSHYGDRLRALWQQEVPAVRSVDVRVAPQPRSDQRPGVAWRARPARRPVARGPGRGAGARARCASTRGRRTRGEWSAPLDPRFTFDTFVVGKPNEFAYACARRVAEAAGKPGLQPAVPLWRRRAGQDAPDARGRLGDPRRRSPRATSPT